MKIDSLAPKRDEDSSEGKVATISVLLSVIEGIKDVSNLMFFFGNKSITYDG